MRKHINAKKTKTNKKLKQKKIEIRHFAPGIEEVKPLFPEIKKKRPFVFMLKQLILKIVPYKLT